MSHTAVIHRKLEGTVVSAQTRQTRIIRVARTMVHPKYGKRYELARRFAAHDAGEVSKLGDRVIIEECRPYSKTKRWRIIKVLVV